MSLKNDVDLRYPIGGFKAPATISRGERADAIATLAELPEQLRNAVDGLSAAQLSTPYRDGGWTVRQVVHHVADSHMNAFIRVKLSLTEDWPTVKPYDEAAWAKLHDMTAPVEWSLELIEALQARWVMLLQSLDEEQWKRGCNHPQNGPMTVEMATLLYAWHSRHHVAHITHLRSRESW
ncbi:MAG: YfiT family bacillithiol transferase [Edaphobacter sp.]